MDWHAYIVTANKVHWHSLSHVAKSFIRLAETMVEIKFAGCFRKCLNDEVFCLEKNTKRLPYILKQGSEKINHC
jgi:hypothetical protein